MEGLRDWSDLPKRVRAREGRFRNPDGKPAHYTPYNTLFDSNMRHHFENAFVQRHLLLTGQVDETGRVVDLDQHRGRLKVLDREFERAKQLQALRAAEEASIRHQVQMSRLAALDDARREERRHQIREDQRVSKALLQQLLRPPPVSPISKTHAATPAARSASPSPAVAAAAREWGFLTTEEEAVTAAGATQTSTTSSSSSSLSSPASAVRRQR